MALNKYTFWDLKEQAVLFQTASSLNSLFKQPAQSSDGAHFSVPLPISDPRSVCLPCTSRAEVLGLAARCPQPGSSLKSKAQVTRGHARSLSG